MPGPALRRSELPRGADRKPKTMRRATATATATALALTAIVATGGMATATPLPTTHPQVGTAALMRADVRCGEGGHWVPAGYAKHGKWRNGHCSRD